MKLHIGYININFNLSGIQPPAGLIAAIALAKAGQVSAKSTVAPAIGEKWPGLEAIYAGKSLSMDGDSIVHLILWLDNPKKGMAYEDAIKYAAAVNPEMESHIPTRHQSIDLFERLQDCFDKDYWHWTLTKTKSGRAAFNQFFNYGLQSNCGLSSEGRVRAVSEIPL